MLSFWKAETLMLASLDEGLIRTKLPVHVCVCFCAHMCG